MAGAAIGAGLGVGTGLIKQHQDEAKYNRQKEMAAQIEANSPWTGVHGAMPNAPDSKFSAALQGGLGGAMMGQQFGASSSPWSSVASNAPMASQDMNNPFSQEQYQLGSFGQPKTFYSGSSWNLK